MSQGAPNRQPNHTTAPSERGLDEGDALGPEYRQRITPIGQSFLLPKRLETISRPSMTVLNFSPREKPFRAIQQWPLEQVGVLGDGAADSRSATISPGLFDHNNLSSLAAQQPHLKEQQAQSTQRFQDATDTPFDSQPRQREQSIPPPQSESGISPSPPVSPDLRRQPVTPPVQISEPVHLPNPRQRSAQLQRQVKHTKTKTLRSLQAQSPQRPTTFNTTPRKSTAPSAQESVIQAKQDPTAPKSSVAETPPTPPLATTPPGYQPTAQDTPEQVLKPTAQRSSDNTETSEPAQHLEPSTSSPSAQSSATPEFDQSTESPHTASTDDTPVTHLLQRPETVKRRVQRTKSRILQTLQTTDTSSSSASTPLQRHTEDQGSPSLTHPSIQRNPEPTQPAAQALNRSAKSGSQLSAVSDSSIQREIEQSQVERPTPDLPDTRQSPQPSQTPPDPQATVADWPHLQRQADTTNKSAPTTDVGDIQKEPLDTAVHTHVTPSSSSPSSSAPVDAISTSSLQRTTTDTSAEQANTERADTGQAKIDIQRESAPERQDSLTDSTSPVRSQASLDSQATVADQPSLQRQAETKNSFALATNTGGPYPTPPSIQRQPDVSLSASLTSEHLPESNLPSPPPSDLSIQRDIWQSKAEQNEAKPPPPDNGINKQPDSLASSEATPALNPQVQRSAAPSEANHQPESVPLSEDGSLGSNETPASSTVQRKSELSAPTQFSSTGKLFEDSESDSALPIQRELFTSDDQTGVNANPSTPAEAVSIPSLQREIPDTHQSPQPSQASPDSQTTVAPQLRLQVPESQNASAASISPQKTVEPIAKAIQRSTPNQKITTSTTEAVRQSTEVAANATIHPTAEPSERAIHLPSESIRREVEQPQAALTGDVSEETDSVSPIQRETLESADQTVISPSSSPPVEAASTSPVRSSQAPLDSDTKVANQPPVQRQAAAESGLAPSTDIGDPLPTNPSIQRQAEIPQPSLLGPDKGAEVADQPSLQPQSDTTNRFAPATDVGNPLPNRPSTHQQPDVPKPLSLASDHLPEPTSPLPAPSDPSIQRETGQSAAKQNQAESSPNQGPNRPLDRQVSFDVIPAVNPRERIPETQNATDDSTALQETVEPTAKTIQRSTSDQEITTPTTKVVQQSTEGSAGKTIRATAETLETHIHLPSESIQREVEQPQASLTGEVSKETDSVSSIQRDPLEGTDQTVISPSSSTPVESFSTPSLQRVVTEANLEPSENEPTSSLLSDNGASEIAIQRECISARQDSSVDSTLPLRSQTPVDSQTTVANQSPLQRQAAAESGLAPSADIGDPLPTHPSIQRQAEIPQALSLAPVKGAEVFTEPSLQCQSDPTNRFAPATDIGKPLPTRSSIQQQPDVPHPSSLASAHLPESTSPLPSPSDPSIQRETEQSKATLNQAKSSPSNQGANRPLDRQISSEAIPAVNPKVQRSAETSQFSPTDKLPEDTESNSTLPIQRESLASGDQTTVPSSISTPAKAGSIPLQERHEPTPETVQRSEVTSTPSLQGAITDTDTEPPATEPLEADSSEIGIQRESISKRQDSSADLTSPVRSQAPLDSQTIVANQPPVQRQAEAENGFTPSTDIAAPLPLHPSIQRQAEILQPSSLDPIKGAEVANEPSLQRQSDATNRGAPATDIGNPLPSPSIQKQPNVPQALSLASAHLPESNSPLPAPSEPSIQRKTEQSEAKQNQAESPPSNQETNRPLDRPVPFDAIPAVNPQVQRLAETSLFSPTDKLSEDAESNSTLLIQQESLASDNQTGVNINTSTPAEPASIPSLQRDILDTHQLTQPSQTPPDSPATVANQPRLQRQADTTNSPAPATDIGASQLTEGDLGMPLDAISTPPLQRATTEASDEQADTERANTGQIEIDIQRARVPEPQNGSADATAPQESVELTAETIQRSTPDQDITAPTTDAVQRSTEEAAGETSHATAEQLETDLETDLDIHLPSKSIQRETERLQAPLTGDVSEETNSPSALSVQREALEGAAQTFISLDSSTPVKAVSTPSLQRNATEASAVPSDNEPTVSLLSDNGASERAIQPENEPERQDSSADSTSLVRSQTPPKSQTTVADQPSLQHQSDTTNRFTPTTEVRNSLPPHPPVLQQSDVPPSSSPASDCSPESDLPKDVDASAEALDPDIHRHAEPTVAQLLAQNAVPQHPASLAPDITVTQPIGAMGLVQPLTELPGSTSDDIAEKDSPPSFAASQSSVSRNQASKNRQARQQRDEHRKQQLDLRGSHYLPPGVMSGVHGLNRLGLAGDAKTRTMMQDALQTKVKVKAAVESRQGKPVKKVSPSEMGELGSAFLPVAEVQVQSEEEKKEDEKKVDGQSFELLAREVYHLLQQRLTVEKERYGGYYRDRVGL